MFGLVKKVLMDIQVTWPLQQFQHTYATRDGNSKYTPVYSISIHFLSKQGCETSNIGEHLGFTWSVPRNSERSKCEDTHQVYSPRSFHARYDFYNSRPTVYHPKSIWFDEMVPKSKTTKIENILIFSLIICHIFQWSPQMIHHAISNSLASCCWTNNLGYQLWTWQFVDVSARKKAGQLCGVGHPSLSWDVEARVSVESWNGMASRWRWLGPQV